MATSEIEAKPDQESDQSKKNWLARVMTAVPECTEDVIAGLVTRDRSAHIGSAARAVKNMRAGRFVEGVREEWSRLEDEGKINEDFAKDPRSAEVAEAVFRVFEDMVPSEVTFDFIRRLFFAAASRKPSDMTYLQTTYFTHIASGLSGHAILVLEAMDRNPHHSVDVETPGQRLSDICGLPASICSVAAEELYAAKLILTRNQDEALDMAQNPVYGKLTCFDLLSDLAKDLSAATRG